MGVNGTLYKTLLFLHVACVIAGFGFMAWNGLYLTLARRRGGAGEATVLDTNAEVSRIAEFLIYAVFIFGILVVATSKSAWKFSQGWLSAAMTLYIVAIGLYHGFIRRAQKDYRQLTRDLTTTPVAAGGGTPPQVGQLEQLQQRINLGWGAFNLIVLAILGLMLFGPPGQ